MKKHGIPLSDQIFILQVFMKEKEKDAESPLNEKLAENFPSLERDMDIQIQEVQRTLGRLNHKRSPRHIAVKLPKVKDK